MNTTSSFSSCYRFCSDGNSERRREDNDAAANGEKREPKQQSTFIMREGERGVRKATPDDREKREDQSLPLFLRRGREEAGRGQRRHRRRREERGSISLSPSIAETTINLYYEEEEKGAAEDNHDER